MRSMRSSTPPLPAGANRGWREAWLFLLALVTVTTPLPALQDGFLLIVNAANPASELSASEVSEIYMKTITRWPNGDPVHPVNLRSEDPVRARFTASVHRRSVEAIRAYWRRMIFTGRDVPPVESATAADVVRQVASERGGIGYVPDDTVLPTTVKSVTLVRE